LPYQAGPAATGGADFFVIDIGDMDADRLLDMLLPHTESG